MLSKDVGQALDILPRFKITVCDLERINISALIPPRSLVSHFKGWPGLVSKCARRARPFRGHALREHRYQCSLQACSLLLKGSTAWSILYCARRTSTFLSCAFREQEDDQAVLPHPYFHPSPLVPPPNPPKFPPKPPCPVPQYSPF